MAFEFCSSGAIIRKAGAGANTTIVASGAALKEWYNYANAYLNIRTQTNWNDKSGALQANYKEIIGEAISCEAAKKVVNYDPDGYGQSIKSQTILDVLDDNAEKAYKMLEEYGYRQKLDA